MTYNIGVANFARTYKGQSYGVHPPWFVDCCPTSKVYCLYHKPTHKISISHEYVMLYLIHVLKLQKDIVTTKVSKLYSKLMMMMQDTLYFGNPKICNYFSFIYIRLLQILQLKPHLIWTIMYLIHPPLHLIIMMSILTMKIKKAHKL